jgi:signal transduction histidine kinase
LLDVSDLLSCAGMSLRQQQVAVFLGTILIISGLFAAGVWLIAQRLTTEATLQTALLMARQVEIALADSLKQRPVIVQTGPSRTQSSSFWSFLGNIFPGKSSANKKQIRVRRESRSEDVKGLMRAYVNRSGSIEAMWVLNAEGKVLYSSTGQENTEFDRVAQFHEALRRGIALINSRAQGKATYYDVMVPLQMPDGVRGPGGLRLWINPADWSELLSGMWRQLTLLFGLGGGIALLSGFLTTALYTRRFRIISETLRQAEAGTYAARPEYAREDEVGTSLDLIDRLVMKQRNKVAAPAPAQRLALAARTLAHEVRTPLNALAIHLELLRSPVQSAEDSSTAMDQPQRSIAVLDSSLRHVNQLIRDFTDYSAPVTMEYKPVDVADVLKTSLEAIGSACADQKISLVREHFQGPWQVQGDATRLRQAFDNLLRNAIEAQPDGGEIRIRAEKDGSRLVVDINDAGPGVSLEQQPQLFEFGKTTKISGSGIGLPLSQLIAEAHGGSLTYQGNGHGATFRLILPLELS